MKKIFIVLLFMSCSLAKAQEAKATVVTTTFTVNGNCGECKERIENAVDIKGVKTSTWDSKTHVLSVTYKPDKVSIDQIKAAILKAGHDVNDQKATAEVYNKLPSCCKFRDGKCEK